MPDVYPNQNEPAYPCEIEYSGGIIRGRQTGNSSGIAHGLTKREWFAGLAMQGMIAVPGHVNTTAATIATWAVEQADALLAELAK